MKRALRSAGSLVPISSRSRSGASEWRYAPVLRYLVLLERSLGKETQWTVFEPKRESFRRRLAVGFAALTTVYLVARLLRRDDREAERQDAGDQDRLTVSGPRAC